MRITSQQFMRLPVCTVSGQSLGSVCSVIYDTDALSIVQIEVRRRLRTHPGYLINKDQIISVSETAVTVSDAVVEEKLRSVVPASAPALLRSGQ